MLFHNLIFRREDKSVLPWFYTRTGLSSLLFLFEDKSVLAPFLFEDKSVLAPFSFRGQECPRSFL